MPCAGPSDSELRDMEAAKNRRELGKSWDDHQFAENVACAFARHLRKGAPLPDWANKWADRHERIDAQREKERKERTERTVKLSKLDDVIRQARKDLGL